MVGAKPRLTVDSVMGIKQIDNAAAAAALEQMTKPFALPKPMTKEDIKIAADRQVASFNAQMRDRIKTAKNKA